MRRFIICLMLLSGTAAASVAQNAAQFPAPATWEKNFAIEAGIGPAPLHMVLLPTAREERAFAENGQEAIGSRLLYTPSFSLSAVWRTGEKTEVVLSMSASRVRYSITQYGVFGIDPDGKPRYDLNDGKDAGQAYSPVSTALNACLRGMWIRDGHWTGYSAIGLGLVCIPDKGAKPDIYPLPTVIPFGMRYGWKHFYACVETGFSLSASLLTAGVGWKF